MMTSSSKNPGFGSLTTTTTSELENWRITCQIRTKQRTICQT